MRTLLFVAAVSIATVVSAADPVQQGRELFTREWKPREPSHTQGDGLGPYFNERSCAACHKLGGVGGAGPNEKNVQLMILRSRHGQDESDTRPARRSPTPRNRVFVLHRESTEPGYATLRLQRLFKVSPRHRELFDLSAPTEIGSDAIRMDGQDYVPADPVAFEERNTPALFGAGLIDRITLDTLKKVADVQPSEVRGRPARVPGGGAGRFGWKGQNETLGDFCENACAVELGLETPTRHQTPRPFERRRPGVPFDGYLGPIVPDMTARDVTELTWYVASLPAPRRVTGSDEVAADVRDGERLFASLGCAVCHRPDLGEVRGIYSDLLLHNVGTSGAAYYGSMPPPVDVVNGETITPAAAEEFRTPPLWGVADSAPYMHDGSAPTINNAIFMHRGQAAGSAKLYEQFTIEQRRKLLAFLDSLRAPSFYDIAVIGGE